MEVSNRETMVKAPKHTHTHTHTEMTLKDIESVGSKHESVTQTEGSRPQERGSLKELSNDIGFAEYKKNLSKKIV